MKITLRKLAISCAMVCLSPVRLYGDIGILSTGFCHHSKLISRLNAHFNELQ